MSMLARYKKKGGFQQLLYLLESCTPARQSQLLNIIEGEDSDWAILLKIKMLTLERVFAWEPQFLAEVTNEIPDKCICTVLSAEPQPNVDKVMASLLHAKAHQVHIGLKSMQTPSKGEVEAARALFLSRIRELEREYKINLQHIDPNLSCRDVDAA